MTCDVPFTPAISQLRETLKHGDLVVEGQLSGASNASLLCTIDRGDDSNAQNLRCVYKPRKGERPLWDFPSGTLSRREVLAAIAALMFDWDITPTTVWRDDGPFGPGMCQEWVEDDASQPAVAILAPEKVPIGWRVIVEGRSFDGCEVVLAHENSIDLQRMAIFDLVINNADRKGGHILRRTDGRLTGIDHGLSFHEEAKLRTVLWGWSGETIPTEVMTGLERMTEHISHQCELREQLRSNLSAREFTAFERRLSVVVMGREFPHSSMLDPALPWPPM
jgi:uncharacterized repeat protein (TIGR03843 family)